jgi:hypothetical protein
MKRRQFIYCATAMLALTIPAGAYARPLAPTTATLAHTGLLDFLGGHDYICKIGQAYRDRYRDESNEVALTAALLSAYPHKRPLSATALNEYINNRVSEDFRKDNMVMLDGWLLARTEARQTALYSILHN